MTIEFSNINLLIFTMHASRKLINIFTEDYNRIATWIRLVEHIRLLNRYLEHITETAYRINGNTKFTPVPTLASDSTLFAYCHQNRRSFSEPPKVPSILRRHWTNLWQLALNPKHSFLYNSRTDRRTTSVSINVLRNLILIVRIL